jgi:type I restriction enzyme S subunit
MIAALKPYSEYRQAGLPWLDSVPKHWEMIPNRALMQEQRRVVGENAKDHTLLSLTLRGVIARDMVNPKGKFPAQFNTYKVVESGDFVFCLFDIDETPRGIGLSCLNGMITGAYDVFRPRQVSNPRFLYYYYLFVDDGKLMKPLYTGLRKTIQRGVFASLKAPCPPPEEQAAMVRFLDYANGRLDRAIRAKRKVIALLHEQKQAIIHRAVTRGLDPTVTLKPSGIPWLGDIPKHWEVKRIKYLLREVDHRSTSGSEPLLSMRRNHGLVLFAEHFTRPPQAATLVGFKIVRPGQFVVNRMQAGNGVIFASTLTGLVSPDYAVFDPIGDANVDFLGELFRSRKVRAKFRAESKGLGTGSSGFLRLYNDRLGPIHVALPPREEQSAILEGLAGELSSVNTAIRRLEREIELLREYRTRLVADVVTGKLDVRGVTLPAESEPPAALAAETIEQDSSEPEEAESPSD